jgi:SAM-dependent methyltransferase
MAWFDEVFAGKYDRFTFALFTPERTREEVEFLERALRLTYQDSVLDVACGHGRHANLLAAEGFSVTGCDNNPRYLEYAAEQAEEPAPTYDRKDIRELDYQEEFTAAYCFFSSFGYYDDATNFQVLQNISRALKPGGRFLLDLQNRELYTGDAPFYQEFSEFELEGKPAALLMQTTFDILTSRVSVRQRLHHSGLAETMNFNVRLYAHSELTWLFRQAGLVVTDSYGEIDGSEYSSASDRCIVTAVKEE